MKTRNKKFSKPSSKKFSNPIAKKILLEEISQDIEGSVVLVEGVLERIAQTGGPTLFSVSDGTATLVLKGFISPGERAYPELEENDIVTAKVKINEYNGAFEGEIINISALSEPEAKVFHKKIEDLQREKAKPENEDFMISDQILEKQKDRFIKAATEIRLAIFQNRPIIVRHHNDTDGYSSGFALERAIVPLIEKQHKSAKAIWEFYTRAPCSAPFYEIDDSIRDTSRSLSNVAKFSNKMPLVIIADNGSSQEDLLAIQQGKVHGMDFIVVDHHFFDEDVISDEVLVHINPFLVGENGSQFSAGMLCSELARFIHEVKDTGQIPAMAGIADRIDNPEAIEAYLKIAKENGYTKELLTDISTVIDFVSAKLKFMEAREYIEIVFGEPKEKQKALVDLMAPYIRKLEEKGLEMGKSAAVVEKIGKVNLQTVEIDKAYPGFGFFPKPGRAIGAVHDYAQTNGKLTSLVTAGLMNTAITFRATDEANFSVHEFIHMVEDKIPQAFVSGGGHKNAGSINFVPSKKAEVQELLKEFIKGR